MSMSLILQSEEFPDVASQLPVYFVVARHRLQFPGSGKRLDLFHEFMHD